jgi:hypothetical protein
MLPECMPAFREPDRHIFMIWFISHVLRESIVAEIQPAGKQSVSGAAKFG